jgi:dihydrolipoamide dehydrogenase
LVAGPGGYVAAIRAAQLGLKPVVIERENLGGICLNWGCIPTKALLRAAELRHSIDEMADFGITVGEVKVDLAAVVKRSRKVAGRLSMGVKHLLKKNKVTVIAAEAKLGAAKGGLRQINLSNGDMVSAKHVIIATGARARALPNIEADWQNHPDLPRSNGSRNHAGIAYHCWFRGDWKRICLILS